MKTEEDEDMQMLVACKAWRDRISNPIETTSEEKVAIEEGECSCGRAWSKDVRMHLILIGHVAYMYGVDANVMGKILSAAPLYTHKDEYLLSFVKLITLYMRLHPETISTKLIFELAHAWEQSVKETYESTKNL